MTDKSASHTQYTDDTDERWGPGYYEHPFNDEIRALPSKGDKPVDRDEIVALAVNFFNHDYNVACHSAGAPRWVGKSEEDAEEQERIAEANRFAAVYAFIGYVNPHPVRVGEADRFDYVKTRHRMYSEEEPRPTPVSDDEVFDWLGLAMQTPESRARLLSSLTDDTKAELRMRARNFTASATI
jgi:hypothetical protein